MILGFKEELFGKPTNFVNKIWASADGWGIENIEPKIHTIRKGNRFKGGEKLHMATGVRTKNYMQFNANLKCLQQCISTQYIQIFNSKDFYRKIAISENFIKQIYLVTRFLSDIEIQELIKNDGFTGNLNEKDFWNYFNKDYFEGQIIHWTGKKY